jgi:hypothetical protein
VHSALAAAFATLFALPAFADAPAPGGGAGIEIAYLNRTWTDLGAEGIPVDEGPLSVRLRSPENRVTVHRNRLALAARETGDPDARIEVELEGEGRLVADVGGGRFATTFTDRVAAPRQSVRVAGRARVTRDAEVYHLTLVDGPASAPLRIRSGAIDEVLRFCRDVGWLAKLDCERLRGSLSTVHVPLGDRERTLDLPQERLSAEERAYLDRFVAR